MDRHSQAVIEKEIWNEYFNESLQGKGQEHTCPLWWSIVDRDASHIIQELFAGQDSISVLEAGCGSGGTSFYLDNRVRISHLCLLDISSKALEFARRITPAHLQGKVEYVEQNLFEMHLGRFFDLVWNVGLIEHYSEEEIRQIVRKMYEATTPGGFMVIGMPNRASIPVLKAALLGSGFGKKILSFLPGYRNTTEILYSDAAIQNLIQEETNQSVTVTHAGSPLWVGAPSPLVQAIDRLTMFRKNAFLTFFVVQRKVIA